MKPLISLIIPVYNVEKYLSKCLETVLGQTYRNLEIILVDDGSEDQSGKLCDEYAGQDARIQVIHKKNGGLSSARNAGLESATGEYIVFVDSDDFLDENYVSYLYEVLIKTGADMSICQMTEFCNGKSEEKICNGEEQIEILTPEAALKRFLLQKNLFASAWCKMYKKELFSDVRYPVGYIYEDMAVIHLLFLKSEKIVWSNQKLYYYRQHHSSIMNCGFNLHKLDRIEIAERLKKDVMSTGPDGNMQNALQVRCFIANIQTLRELPNKKKYRQYRDQIERNIKDYRKITLLCKEAKASTRLMAMISYMGIYVLKMAGNLYSLVFKKI